MKWFRRIWWQLRCISVHMPILGMNVDDGIRYVNAVVRPWEEKNPRP